MDYTYYQEYPSRKDSSNKFIIRSFQEIDLDETAKLIADIHESHHPAMINVPNIKKDIQIATLKGLIESIRDQDLSVVVLDYNTQKIIGFMGVYDIAKPMTLPKELQGAWPEVDPFIECLSIFDTKYAEFRHLKEEKKLAHLFFLVTHPDYQGQGLATNIMKIIEDHPKLLEFKMFDADAASNYSQKLMEKFGFKVLETIEYEAMQTSTGEHPFKDIRENLRRKNLSEDHLYYSYCILIK